MPATSRLAQAHAAARLRGTLADALRSPVLARCLEITAEAMAADHTQPVMSPFVRCDRSVSPRTKPTPPRRDVKRESAGDMD